MRKIYFRFFFHATICPNTFYRDGSGPDLVLRMAWKLLPAGSLDSEAWTSQAVEANRKSASTWVAPAQAGETQGGGPAGVPFP